MNSQDACLIIPSAQTINQQFGHTTPLLLENVACNGKAVLLCSFINRKMVSTAPCFQACLKSVFNND